MVDDIKTVKYQQRVLDQTRLWSEGKPTHNIADDECCADFSCCNPEMFTKSKADRVNHYLTLQVQYGRIQ